MRTALYMEGRVLQVVLTPEDAFEASIVALVEARQDVAVRRGSFYETVGGWVREGADRDSLMLVLGVEPGITPTRTL